jgi:hypothetical protein
MIPAPRRSGFALATAVCMLAAVSGLAAASAFAVREARREAIRVTRQEEATSAADSALFAAISALERLGIDSMRVGSTEAIVAANARVTRITETLYSVTAVGRAGVGTSVEATRVHGLLMESVYPVFPTRAAILSRGNVLVSGGVGVSGVDRSPPGWTGCPAADSLAGHAIAVPEGRVALDGVGSALPDVHTDSTAGDSDTYRLFGRVTAADLTALANVAAQPGAMLASPSIDDRNPRVIHATGDIVVTAAQGRGILLVDGRLRIEGPFTFSGVIVAMGGIEASGTDVNVYGAVLSAGEAGVDWRAGGEIQRSTCAVNRAAAVAARLTPIASRGWSELF